MVRREILRQVEGDFYETGGCLHREDTMIKFRLIKRRALVRRTSKKNWVLLRRGKVIDSFADFLHAWQVVNHCGTRYLEKR